MKTILLTFVNLIIDVYKMTEDTTGYNLIPKKVL